MEYKQKKLAIGGSSAEGPHSTEQKGAEGLQILCKTQNHCHWKP